jgi:TldD protein
MRDRLEQALRAGRADYLDIRVEDAIGSRIDFQGEELDRIVSNKTLGGIVRALVKGGWGYATFNDLSDLAKPVEEACQAARLVGHEETQFAPVDPVVDVQQATMVKDFRQIPLSEKKAVVEEYNRLILGHHPKIQTTHVAYGDRFRKIWFASSEGAYIADEQPHTWIMTMVTARDGDIVQQAYGRRNGNDGFQVAEGFHAEAEKVAQRAVDLLSAASVTGGTYTVVIDPVLAGVFIHEAFGHLSESDFVYENERMKELMELGKRFGPDMLHVIDDGGAPGGLGTHRHDFEGSPTGKTYLIRDGILVGRLHSRETAAKMAEGPTGNARSIGYQFPPIVRMTNTYIDKGTASFEEMIRDIKLGVYAIDAFGGQTALEMFTFSAGYGYMIRDGQVAELVRDVVLTGNVFETLRNIDSLSDKVEWNPGFGPGGCGKGGQHPLSVGTGGPHVRIQNVVIGGRQ